MTYSFYIRKQNYHTRILGWTYLNIFINSRFSLPLNVKSWKVLSENIHPTPKCYLYCPWNVHHCDLIVPFFYPLNKYSVCWTYEWEKLGLLRSKVIFYLKAQLSLFSMFLKRLDSVLCLPFSLLFSQVLSGFLCCPVHTIYTYSMPVLQFEDYT